jgi:hypothetical protein
MKFKQVLEDINTLMKQKEMLLKQKSDIDKKIFNLDKQIETERTREVEKTTDPLARQQQVRQQLQATKGKPIGYEPKQV